MHANTKTAVPQEQQNADEDRDMSIYQQIRDLLEEMERPERNALGLYIFWLADTSHAQLCHLEPKYGEFPPKLNEAITLIKQLQPQTLIELGSEVLLEDWDSADTDDAPSITIE